MRTQGYYKSLDVIRISGSVRQEIRQDAGESSRGRVLCHAKTGHKIFVIVMLKEACLASVSPRMGF